MSAISALNPKAEVARSGQALLININAAAGLQDVLKTNLGPRGTIKMCVGKKKKRRARVLTVCARAMLGLSAARATSS